MSSPEQNPTMPAEESGAGALFPSDTGTLPLDTRRVLAQLLAGPSLDGRRHSKLWPALLRDEHAVRSRLSELFLELVMDRDLQVAFTRRADVGELEAPVLLRSTPLTFLDSVLILFLRSRLTEADVQGQRAVVSADEMAEHLSVFERSLSTDHSGFKRRVQSSIDKMKERSILSKIRSTEDRFEVSATLKLLFSADEISALSQLYHQMASGTSGRVSDGQGREDLEV